MDARVGKQEPLYQGKLSSGGLSEMDQSAAYRKEGECKLYSETTERPIPSVIAIQNSRAERAFSTYFPQSDQISVIFFSFFNRAISIRKLICRVAFVRRLLVFLSYRELDESIFGSKLFASS